MATHRKDEKSTKGESVVGNAQSTTVTDIHIADKTSLSSRFRFFKTRKGKVIVAAIAAVMLLVGTLLVVPTTRYGILGSFIRKDLVVAVIDSETYKPVSDAEVSVLGITARTDNSGHVILHNVQVGVHQMTIKKKYYKDATQTVLVPIMHDADTGQVRVEAIGRQVPIRVVNRITGEVLPNVTIASAEATAITDDKGEATLVVPAEGAAVKATLQANGYIDTQADITVIEQKDDKNTVRLVPSGTAYFLSKRTGKIDVMKANLDGSNSQTVLAGTGKEEDGGTILLASRDWKYLLLKSKRDSQKPKLYLINTATDQMRVVDEGNADFNLVGWHNHTFIYSIERLDVKEWQPKRTALKSFDADGNTLTALDESQGEGTGSNDYRYEDFSSIFSIDSQGVIVYVKSWNGYAHNKQASIVSVQPNGTNKKNLKTFDPNVYVARAVPYKADEIYYAAYDTSSKARYYEYEAGAIKEAPTTNENDFTQFYPTYLLSPSGKETFWYEPRDGKNTLMIGDVKGENGKEIAALSEYTPYGWYTNDYLLVSKGGSELYVLPAHGVDISKALKITDYHKPSIVFKGYGGGYGGGF